MSDLYRVEAPHYVAGFIVEDGVCIEAAPILGWSEGKTLRYLLSYFRRKGFTVLKVSDGT